jgi:hypothetical protein
MVDFNSGIDNGNAHTFASPLFQSAPRLIQAERAGVWR